MDKKVLAIIAIAVFHLALMWFIRGSLKPEEPSHVSQAAHPDVSPIEPNPYLPPTALVAEQASIDRPERSERAVPATVRKKQKSEPVFRRASSSADTAERFTAGVIKPIPVPPAAPPQVFQNTIIWVKKAEVRPIYLAEKGATVEPKVAPAAKIAPIKKKKTFFKKAVPVIRKPYEWIKTLFSKM